MAVLVIALPEQPDVRRPEVHWWLVADGAVAESGAGAEWLSRRAEADGERRRLVGIAPAAAVRVEHVEPGDGAATPRQAAAVARMAAIERSLGDPETLHAVSALPADSGEPVITAVVANAAMLQWIDWSAALGAELDHIVPAAMLLPRRDEWTAATIGGEHLVGRGGLVLANEPALASAIVGPAEVQALDPPLIEEAIARAAEAPPLDLRSGRFAKRRRLVIDRDRVRELVLLACLIPLITLLWAVISIVRLEGASDRLDAETLRIAEAALGRPVELADAEAELRQRSGGGGAGLTASAAALYAALEPEAAVSSTQLGYGRDGTLAVTLAAPSVDAINRVLVALQRDGYRVTAVPRQSTDGRMMIDATVRSGE